MNITAFGYNLQYEEEHLCTFPYDRRAVTIRSYLNNIFKFPSTEKQSAK